MTLAPWTKIFNVSGGQITPNLAWTAPGYKFEVEPQGPELPDTGDPAGDFGFPAPPLNLPSPIGNGATADTNALADLAADTQLQSKIELAGGSFVMAHIELMQSPDESGAEGDWLIPYDGAGGINDITGAVMIDAETGVIDEATWIDPNDPNQLPFTLSQLEIMMDDQLSGDLPSDNTLVPEPSSIVLLLCGGLGLLASNWRKTRS